jgi:hypothetical protein
MLNDREAFKRCETRWLALGMSPSQALDQARHERAVRIKQAHTAGMSLRDIAEGYGHWLGKSWAKRMIDMASQRSPAEMFLARGTLDVLEMERTLNKEWRAQRTAYVSAWESLAP